VFIKEAVTERSNVDLAHTEHQENTVFASTFVRMVASHYKGATQTTTGQGFMQNITTWETLLD
jgi:hypothetical protein